MNGMQAYGMPIHETDETAFVAWLIRLEKDIYPSPQDLQIAIPANQLYEAFGFQYVDTVSMYYEDTGWEQFRLYELIL